VPSGVSVGLKAGVDLETSPNGDEWPAGPPGGKIGETTAVTVGLIHPGEMGAAVGATLRAAGETVVWASTGRSAATRQRAERAGLEDVGSVRALCRRCDVLICVCPPHAAVEVAAALPAFSGIYLDANAVSPGTARTIAGQVGRYVDGGIVGPPPHGQGTTRLYLSGPEAGAVATLLAGTLLEATVVSDQPGAASALKMTYAAWTKGTAALLLAIRSVARVDGVEDALLREWRISLPDLQEQSAAAARAALRKGWRWSGEMEEIAQTFEAAGLPDGFHLAAAEIYRRAGHEPVGEGDLGHLLAALAARTS
jgi:3-hydroxyisobutyrate dehydrogenase-like beta-hydroxyacid dehydrogenase